MGHDAQHPLHHHELGAMMDLVFFHAKYHLEAGLAGGRHIKLRISRVIIIGGTIHDLLRSQRSRGQLSYCEEEYYPRRRGNSGGPVRIPAAPDTRTVAQTLYHVAAAPKLQQQIHAVERRTTLEGFDFPSVMRRLIAEEQTPRSKAQLIALLREDGETLGRMDGAVV